MNPGFVPVPEWLNLEWHHATIQAGALCLQRCTDCGAWRQPPRQRCAVCFSPEYAFLPVAGRGRIASYAVSHRSADPYWQAQAPFITLVVELEEGPRVLAATALGRDEISIGLPVEVHTTPLGDDLAHVEAR